VIHGLFRSEVGCGRRATAVLQAEGLEAAARAVLECVGQAHRSGGRRQGTVARAYRALPPRCDPGPGHHSAVPPPLDVTVGVIGWNGRDSLSWNGRWNGFNEARGRSNGLERSHVHHRMGAWLNARSQEKDLLIAASQAKMQSARLEDDRAHLSDRER
jgi:hypothetical protein